MATERQRRLYEAIEKQPYPLSETLAGRKEASDLSRKLGVEHFSYDSTPSRHNQRRDAVEQSEARRRRIYENEYNRPYPSRKRIQLFCGTESFASSVTSLRTPHVVSPEMRTPSPTRKCIQDSIYYDPAVSDEDLMSPHDETAENISPCNLWRTTCGGTDMVEETEDAAGNAPVDEVMICTPPRGGTSLKKQGSGRRRNVTFKLSRSSSSGDSANNTETPYSYRPPAVNVSPISAQNNHSSGCVPSAPIRVVCAPLAPIIQNSLQKKSSVEERTGIAKGHRQHESHQALQNFLKRTEDDTLKLYIDDYQASIFDRIVESFYGNTSLKSLTISRNKEVQLGSHRTLAEMACLFEAIRCLPHLETLIVWNARSDILPTMAENLPRSVSKLCLQVIDGSVPNFVLDTIAEKENLKNVQLETKESMELGRLVNSPSIKTLGVCGIWHEMDAHHMQGLADSLHSNLDSPLETLDIQPTMDLSGWKSLATALRHNFSVRTLKMSFMGASMEERNAATVELAELLHANTTLTHISNYTHDAVVISVEIANDIIMEALQANTTLVKFHFFREESIFWAAKHAVLKANEETFGKAGDLSHTFIRQYVSFASALPSMKAKMCGEC